MVCEASRRSREGSPLIPGLIWRFCSPSGFAMCHWHCSLARTPRPYLLRQCVKGEVLVAYKQLQALKLCDLLVSSSAQTACSLHLQQRGASGAARGK